MAFFDLERSKCQAKVLILRSDVISSGCFTAMSDGILSSSPSSHKSSSPVRRRGSASASVGEDRPRLSPTLARTTGFNDNDLRERQREMDRDMAMAMQRSRVRRDTVSDDVEPIVDLRDHLNPTQDPTLLVGHNDESTIALPTYQPIQSPVRPVPSSSVFDFAHIEEFASKERAALQQTQTSAKFSIPPRKQQRQFTDEVHRPQAEPIQAPAESEQSQPQIDPSPSHPTPSRRLSESNALPRPRQRKGIGGKLAMFESSNVGGHESNVNSFLGIPPQTGPSGALISTASSFENLPTVYDSGVVSKYGLGVQDQPIAGTSAAGGMLNTGHDRPYRFSFYSNALSATIHARSLHELPAEGQSFEELFTGVKPGTRDQEGLGKGSNEFSTPKEKERPVSTGVGRGYFASNMKPRRSALLGGGAFGGFTGGFGSLEEEAEANTWWLDVTSPTDEEMKILSKVSAAIHGSPPHIHALS